jgi:hypothetical protein
VDVKTSKIARTVDAVRGCLDKQNRANGRRGTFDIRNMQNLATPRFNTVDMDDSQSDLSWYVDSALEEHHRRDMLQKLLSVSIAPRLGSRGLNIATYA